MRIYIALACDSWRAISFEGSHTIGGEDDVGINQVCGMGRGTVDMNDDGLALCVQLMDGSFQVDDFGCAPVDALSKVEDHNILAPLLQYVFYFRLTLFIPIHFESFPIVPF